ncbi:MULTISPECIES: hypothetical protein [unclassified Xanthobacter]|uniref:hypothetical protein n=1 Tax=unclassified Xanthobacter TaxID=2623496 RepID=UPI001F2198D2|nr:MULTISPECIES: hypothetical protein [unclassified Xanthobacter]
MNARLLTLSERGDLFSRMAIWTGPTGLDRLTLFQIAGAAKLEIIGCHLLAEITVDELGRLLGRSLSTVRASLGALRDMGLAVRAAGRRAAIDLTATARMVGFDIQADTPTFVGDAPAAPRRNSFLGTDDVSRESACMRLGNVAGKSESSLQDFGGSPLYDSKDSSLEIDRDIESISIDSTDQDSAGDFLDFPQSEVASLIETLRSSDLQKHLEHGQDIAALLAALPENWSSNDLEVVLPDLFGPSATGPGVSPSLIASGAQRYGRGLLLHAIAAFLLGQKPKGLLIHLLRTSRREASFSLASLRRAISEAERRMGAEQARHQLEADEEARVKAQDAVRQFLALADAAPQLDPDCRRAVSAGGAGGYARLDRIGEQDRLTLAFPRANDVAIWKSIADRVANPADVHGFMPHVVVISGALAGSRRVRIGEWQ